MRPNLLFAMDASKTQHVFDDALIARLGESCTVLSTTPTDRFDNEEARRLLAETEILVSGWGCPMIGPEVLQAAPRLRLIAHAAGTVKFTVDPAVYEAGIRVTHSAEANAVPVAEYTLAAILFSAKQVFAFRDLYRRDPSRHSTYHKMDEPIGNFRRTVGIVGASRIGRRVIELLRSFEYSVLLYDPFVVAGEPGLDGVELVSLDTLMARSDVVSVHAPSLPATRAMIGPRQLKLMQDGATLINTARGSLIDEAAMVAELETGRIFGVIDVTDPEVPHPSSPLFSLPNVFLTPHVAGAIGTERLRLGLMAVEEIERFVAGRPMLYEIQPELLERLA